MQLFLTKYKEFILLFIIFLILSLYTSRGQKFDYKVYFQAAQKISMNISPYDAEENLSNKENAFPFKYAPVITYLFVPFTWFNYDISLVIFNILSILALISSLYLCKFTAQNKNTYYITMFLSFLFILKPILSNIELGQINFFMLLGFTLIYTLHKNRTYTSIIFRSFIYSLLILTKLTPGLFLLIPIIEKDYKILVNTALIIIILLFLPMIFIGFDQNLLFIQHWLNNAFIPNIGLTPFWTNQSLLGLLERLVGDRRYEIYLTLLSKNTVLIVYFFISLTLCTFSIIKLITKKNLHYYLSILFSLFVIISPLSFQHYYIFLIFPFIYLYEKKAYKELFIAYILINFSNHEVLGLKFNELVHMYSIMLFAAFIIFIKLLIEKEKT